MLEEMSRSTGFSGNRLRRDGELRTAESLGLAVADARARFYLAAGGRFLVATADDRLRAYFTASEAEALGASLSDSILLGYDAANAPVLAAAIEAREDYGPDLAAMELRAIGMEGRFDADTEGQLAQAAHLVTWHGKHQFCGVCGARTRSEAAGYRRECMSCDNIVFPRIDPVTIMLVHDGNGRCVLGRQPRFPENFWSCLAGFVEPGETLEDAVRRETLEEAGLEVGAVRFLASQPWPFPGNLMIGCMALASSANIVFDDRELEACRWFDREEVAAMFDGRHPDGLSVPKPFAIAHHLIKAFVDEV